MLSKIHVSRSIGNRISAASTRQRPPRKSQLCSMLSRLVHTPDQQSVVAAVRAPGNVEHIAEHRDRADHNFDRDVGHHASDRDVETPRTHAAMMMMQEAMPPIRSPMPGTKPTIPSRPKRIEVPGILMKSSSTCDRRSRFSSSNALPPRFRRGDRTSGFAVNAIGPPSMPCRGCPRGAGAIIPVYGGYSSVAERRSVAADVVGSKPTSRPKNFSSCYMTAVLPCPAPPKSHHPYRLIISLPELRAGLIPRGSRSFTLRAPRRSGSSNSMQHSSPRLRSITPSARCRR